MKKIIIGCLACGMFIGANAQNFRKNNATKTAKVILTNHATNEKMADKGTFTFTEFGQPKGRLHFCSPDFKYQKLMGIGGAIIDASAETFYKLPKDKQQELLRLITVKTE